MFMQETVNGLGLCEIQAGRGEKNFPCCIPGGHQVKQGYGYNTLPQQDVKPLPSTFLSSAPLNSKQANNTPRQLTGIASESVGLLSFSFTGALKKEKTRRRSMKGYILAATLVREQRKPPFCLIKTKGKKETMSLLEFSH